MTHGEEEARVMSTIPPKVDPAQSPASLKEQDVKAHPEIVFPKNSFQSAEDESGIIRVSDTSEEYVRDVEADD